MTAIQAALLPVGEPEWTDARPTPAEAACSSCGAPVVVALEDRVGPPVAADPIALTPLGELQALTSGRRTFSHWHEGLDTRRAWVIARVPAGTGDNPVRPEHRCGAPPPDHVPTPPAPDARPDRIPF